MSLLTGTLQDSSPAAAPSWLSLPARIKWNYEFEEYATQWFMSLSTSDINAIFDVYEKQIRNIPIGRKRWEILAQKYRGQAVEDLRNLKGFVFSRRSTVTRSSSRKLFELFNYDFFVMKTRFARSDMNDTDIYVRWHRKVVNAFPKVEREVAQLSDFFEKEKVAEKVEKTRSYDYSEDLNRLPKAFRVRIIELEAEVKNKLKLNVDIKTHHELGKINDEFLPEIVKSYANAFIAYNKQDTTTLTEVDTLAKEQLTALEGFVSKVESRAMDEALRDMRVQRQFIVEKFTPSTLSNSNPI